MIPNHIIDKFKDTFKQYPSVIEIHQDYINFNLDRLFKNSKLIWINEEIKSEGTKIVKDRVFEYDPTGIYVLINSDNKLFIDRKSTRLNSSHVSESRMPSSA